MKNLKSKTLSVLFFVLGAQLSLAQVVIGGGTTPTNQASVLLEFSNTNDRGIIVPYTNGETTGAAATPGTLIFDTSVNRLKMSKSAGWFDLSNNTGVSDSSIQTGLTEGAAAKVIMGGTSSTAEGVLVLESPTKAMILPRVTNTDNIINPSPGMLVYVNNGTLKRLATFNGAKWTFFEPI